METAVVIALVAGLSLALIATILVLSRSKGAPEPGSPPASDAPPSALTTRELIKRFGKPGFVPEIAPGDQGRSHFGGRPWLAEGEDWPICENCSQPMQLILQLDLDALPNGAPAQRSGGLAQVFYCTNQADECELSLESWDPTTPGKVVRVVDPSRPGGQAPKDLTPRPFAAQAITGWTELEDLPSLEELAELDVVLSDEVRAHLAGGNLPKAGDKLGGWPHWLDGVDYPRCPDCGDVMEPLFQVGSEQGVPFEWGDGGQAYVSRCRRHSTNLALIWAAK